MGKGDRRTTRGKIFRGSFGNSRPHKVKKKTASVSAAATPAAETTKKTPAKRRKKEAE